jgi:hypothetical protein
MTLVAEPVLELTEHGQIKGRVVGAGRTGAYLDFDGFIVVSLPLGSELMPNCIAHSRAGPAPARGTRVSLAPGHIGSDSWRVEWDPHSPPAWDPRLRVEPSGDAIAARGVAILIASGVSPQRKPEAIAAELATSGISLGAGVELLLRSIAEREPSDAADAARLLIGRGAGLTPQGDDMITAAVAVIGAVAAACGWTSDERRAWLDAAIPSNVRFRTTALSATLFELARGGNVVEPLQTLFDLGAEGASRWRSQLGRLIRIGSSTGRTYAAAAGAAAFLAGSTRRRDDHQTTRKETNASSRPVPGLLGPHTGVRQL